MKRIVYIFFISLAWLRLHGMGAEEAFHPELCGPGHRPPARDEQHNETLGQECKRHCYSAGCLMATTLAGFWLARAVFEAKSHAKQE